MSSFMRLVGILFAILLAVAAVTFYVLSTKLDEHSLVMINESISRLQIIERDWTVELVKVNSNPEADFDTLASFAPAFRTESDQLKTIVASAPELSNQDRSAVQAYLSMLDGKEERIERFKSGYAIVRNSERYLPIAAAEAAAISRENDAEELAATVDANLAVLRDYLSSPNEVDRQRILLGLEGLRESSGSLPAAVGNRFATLVAHATVLLQQKAPLNELLREASSPLVGAEAKRLSIYFDEARDRIAQTKRRYERYALILAGACAMYMMFFSIIGVLRSNRRGSGQLAELSVDSKHSSELLLENVVAAEAGVSNDQDSRSEHSVGSRSTTTRTGPPEPPDQLELDHIRAGVLLDDVTMISAGLRSQTRLLREFGHEFKTGIEQATKLVDQAIELNRANPANPEARAVQKSLAELKASITELRVVDPGSKTSQTIHRAGDRIQRTANALANTANYAGTRYEQWCDINTCLQHAIDVTEIDLHADVHLEVAELPPILGVESEFVTIFANILGNCEDALAENPTVRIKTEVHENDVGITIIDNGIGMDGTTRKSAFRMHFSTKASDRGTGLGIVNNLVKRHHGQVMLNSAPTKGTVVRLTFPVDVPSIDEAPVRSASKAD